jgi:WD40 repeat protein
MKSFAHSFSRFIARERSWTWSCCLMLVLGCGTATQESSTSSAAAQSPSAAGAASKRPAQVEAETREQNPQKTEKARPTAPTKEQIERWTPAPFERLELLAIREWEKTSFTGRLAAAPDGQHFLVAGSHVLLWSVTKEEPEHVFLELTPADKDRVILSLAVSPDGRWFAAGDSMGTMRIWGLADRQQMVERKLGSTGISWLAISPDAQEIATISYSKDVAIWDAATLEPRKKFKVDASGLKRIEYAAPGRLAAAGESTSLWNTSSGEKIHELSPGRYSFALARSPDATRLIFGGKESLRIWHIEQSRVESEMTRDVSGSELIAFSPDGKLLATTNGRSIQLWNLAERGIVQFIDSFGWPIVDVSWLPKSDLLVVASDIGCTRIWGTANHGKAIGLAPLHAPVPMPRTGSDAPATPAQREQAIDLRTLPRLPDAEPTIVSQGNFQCTVIVSADEALTFYRYFLEKEGWAAAKTPATPATVEFQKNGFTVTVQCYDAGGGKTSVMVHNAGNYDLRRVPKFDGSGVEPVYESANSVLYRTKSDIVRIETTLFRKLHAAGWTGYSTLNSSHTEQPDRRDLSFLRNGTTLWISIDKTPDDPGRFNIQYSVFADNASVPVPPDSGFVEFNGSTAPALVATTGQTLDQAREFYDRELTADGWLIRELGRSLKEDHCWLTYLRGQSDVTIGLSRLPDGRTLVRVGDSVDSLWALSQKKEEPAAATNAENLEAADFPVLQGAQPAVFDASAGSIDVTLEKTTLAMAADQFTKALEMLGWMLQKGGIRGEDYTLLEFHKGKKEITLRARVKDNSAKVNFQGNGLVWNKELPTGRPVVSYASWLRQQKLPASLDWIERYETDMRSRISSPAAKPPRD